MNIQPQISCPHKPLQNLRKPNNRKDETTTGNQEGCRISPEFSPSLAIECPVRCQQEFSTRHHKTQSTEIPTKFQLQSLTQCEGAHLLQEIRSVSLNLQNNLGKIPKTTIQRKEARQEVRRPKPYTLDPLAGQLRNHLSPPPHFVCHVCTHTTWVCSRSQ